MPVIVTDRVKGETTYVSFHKSRAQIEKGQYINGKKVLRSYTISSTPSRPYVLEVTIKRVPGGLVSNWMADT